MNFKSVERQSIEVMMMCPRFSLCSAPKCPLDSLQSTRCHKPGEAKCTASKTIRRRIGKEVGLKYQGLTKSEWVASQRWSSLSEIEKGRRTAHLRIFWFNPKRKSDRQAVEVSHE